MSGPLEAFARETEPRDGAVERLRGRRVPGAVASLRDVDEVAVARLRARVRTRRPRRRSWVPAVAVALAAAMAAFVVIPRLDRDLDQTLIATERAEVALTSDVHLAYTGTGRVDGTATAPRIHWEEGTLDVEVTPHAGVDLVVDTLDGQVRVVGTAFTVTRDALGTVVAVRRGTVEVGCGDEAEARVEAGGVRMCLPTRPAGWLGRARALRDAGAPADAVLDAVDRGLRVANRGDDAVGELVALRLDVLVVAERYAEALDAAEAYLRSGATARRADVEALVTVISARSHTRP